MRRYLVLVAMMLVGAPLAAQGPSPVGLAAHAGVRADSHWTPSFSGGSVPETEWKKGMIIGGIVGAGLSVLAYAAFHGICDSDCGVHPGGFLLTIGICSLIGGMIGSMSPKR